MDKLRLPLARPVTWRFQIFRYEIESNRLRGAAARFVRAAQINRHTPKFVVQIINGFIQKSAVFKQR